MTPADREQIVDLMVRYGRSCDTEDWALLESCFTPDAVITYSRFGDEIRGAPALEEYLRTALAPLDATQHLFANFAIETDGDGGHFRCLVQAQHVQQAAPGGPLFTVGGTYEIDVTRTPNGWRMTRMDFVPSWMDGNPKVLEHLLQEEEAESA